MNCVLVKTVFVMIQCHNGGSPLIRVGSLTLMERILHRTPVELEGLSSLDLLRHPFYP